MNYDRWAKRYDIFYESGPAGEVEFYIDAIERFGGPVLEIGVGTGRIAIPAAAKGHRVVGIDLHEPMLERARAKISAAGLTSDAIDLIQADMTTFDLGPAKFETVIIPANTLALALDEAAQQMTLKRAAAHMVADGALIFNIYNPTPDMIYDDSEDEFLIGVVDSPDMNLRHVLTGINRFDNENQINRCTQIIETLSWDGETVDREELAVTTRYLHHHQVLAMLSAAGLEATEIYGDFDRSPLSDELDEMIYICKPV